MFIMHQNCTWLKNSRFIITLTVPAGQGSSKKRRLTFLFSRLQAQQLTRVAAHLASPSSEITSSTLWLRFSHGMECGSRRAAENWMFSRTVSIPITMSSWQDNSKQTGLILHQLLLVPSTFLSDSLPCTHDALEKLWLRRELGQVFICL